MKNVIKTISNWFLWKMVAVCEARRVLSSYGRARRCTKSGLSCVKGSFFILFLAISCFSSLPAQAATAQEKQAAQKVADHFSRLRTMTGEFIQIGPRGEQAEGTFYLERPGKIRFTYNNSPIRVIADGKSVVINNKKLDTWDLYQLKQTPMKLLLDDPIILTDDQFVSYQENDATITITLANTSLGGGKIRLTFDRTSFDLQQWVLIDQQNLETTLRIKSVRSGVRFAEGMFKIDYQRIAMRRKN